MDNVIVLCFATIFCIIVNSGEGYFIQRNRNYKDERTGNGVVHNQRNEIQKAAFSRGLQVNENAFDKEILARKEVEADVEELLNTFKAAGRFRLNKKATRRGWLFCLLCGGSKYSEKIAGQRKCKCNGSGKILCKCPHREILTQEKFEYESFST